jgi:ketosteroid isomerase-like protein
MRKVLIVTTEVLTPFESVKEYYRLIDSGELDSAFAMFADDAVVRFMDDPPIHGREVISTTVRGMLAGLVKSISHTALRSHEVTHSDGTTSVIFEQTVTYVMLRSGNTISHNGVSVSDVDNATGRIIAQRNVGNLAPVLADHQAHA